MELLAPAGNRKNFMAALEAGANAIYLGGKVFNARAKASNFSIEELKEMIKLAHTLGVAIYVTVNILIADQELKELENYIKTLDEIGVDGIIVQDLAVLEIARKIAKRMEIHGSTQMTATNLATVNYLYEQGMTRVVVSRELSLEEIEHICKNTKAEIEVFIHGALCICYSGQCLMSSLIGGRSGNRGACAQPCRLPYELVDNEGNVINKKEQTYIMSPKDLNYAEYMDRLIDAGVASFKVEGRMKKPSYVREVIGAYRNIIDKAGKASKKDLSQLESGFNRGFTTEYLRDQVGRNMMTIVAPNNQGREIGKASRTCRAMELELNYDVEEGDLIKIISKQDDVRYFTVDKSWKKQKDGKYIATPEEAPAEGIVYLAATAKQEIEYSDMAHFKRKIPVYAYLDGNEGETVSCTLMTESGESVTVYNDYVLQKARNKPTSIEKVSEQIGRLGNTVFFLENVSTPQGEFMWPASVLNQLRRDAIEALELKLLSEYENKRNELPNYNEIEKVNNNFVKSEGIKPKISVRLDEIDGVKAAIETGVDQIIFGGDRLQRRPYKKGVYKEFVDLCKKAKVKSIIVTPRIVKTNEEAAYYKTFTEIVEANPDAISINFLGALLWCKELSYKGTIFADTSLNTFNLGAINVLINQGISQIALSEELTLKQIKTIKRKLKNSRVDIEVVVQGELEMMISEYCAISAFAGTGKKEHCPMPCIKEQYYLKDRKGELFPLKTDPYCRMHVMNSKILDMKPYMEELMKADVDVIRLELRQQDQNTIKSNIKIYKEIIGGKPYTGKKDVPGITRGHYFKGIL